MGSWPDWPYCEVCGGYCDLDSASVEIVPEEFAAEDLCSCREHLRFRLFGA